MSELLVMKQNGKWRYMFEGARIAGKRQRISKSGFKTKGEALKAGAKALNEYNTAGMHFVPSEMSVSDFYYDWLKNYAEINLKPKTCYNYRKRIDGHILPVIGKYRLAALTPSVLQSLLNDLFDSGMSRNSLSTYKGLLTGPMSWAVHPMQYIQVSPAHCLKLPSRRAVPQKPTKKDAHIVISQQDWKRIIDRFPEGHPSHIPLMLGYYAGLRLGEAFGLMWRDIDFSNGTITINQQVQYDETIRSSDGSMKRRTSIQALYLSDPKYESFRTFKASSRLLGLLKAERSKQLQNRQKYMEYYSNYFESENRMILDQKQSDTDIPIYFVNVRENGTLIRPRIMQHTSRVISQDLGIEGFDFHSLRKTHATRLLESGANPKDVQHRLGHKTLRETMEIYAEVTPAMEDQSLEILENMA